MDWLVLLALFILSARGSGGEDWSEGDMPKSLKHAPEVAFALGVTSVVYSVLPCPFIALVTLAGVTAAMETGHGSALQWGRHPRDVRQHRLSPVVNFLAGLLGLPVGGVGYCRLFMAVKGFLIGLPLGGLPLALLWPLCYEIGHGRLKKFWLSEVLTGVATFVSALLFTLVVRKYTHG